MSDEDIEKMEAKERVYKAWLKRNQWLRERYKRRTPTEKKRQAEYFSEYNQRPEVKARRRELNQRPEVKKRKAESNRKRYQRPEVKAGISEYHKARNKRPEVKKRNREYMRKYRAKQKSEEE